MLIHTHTYVYTLKTFILFYFVDNSDIKDDIDW